MSAEKVVTMNAGLRRQRLNGATETQGEREDFTAGLDGDEKGTRTHSAETTAQSEGGRRSIHPRATLSQCDRRIRGQRAACGGKDVRG